MRGTRRTTPPTSPHCASVWDGTKGLRWGSTTSKNSWDESTRYDDVCIVFEYGPQPCANETICAHFRAYNASNSRRQKVPSLRTFALRQTYPREGSEHECPRR